MATRKSSKKNSTPNVEARLESLEKAVIGLTAVVAELVKLHQTEAKPAPKSKAKPKAKAEPKPKAKAKEEPKASVVITSDKYHGLAGFRELKADCVKAGVKVEKGDNKVALLAKLQKAQKKGKK